MQVKNKESIIGRVNKLSSRRMLVIQHQKNKFQKLKFSVQMQWKNILKSKPTSKDNQNQLLLHKFKIKKYHKPKKILVKAQINTLMMNLIQYLEARAK